MEMLVFGEREKGYRREEKMEADGAAVEGKVECPICQLGFMADEIEAHVAFCIEGVDLLERERQEENDRRYAAQLAQEAEQSPPPQQQRQAQRPPPVSPSNGPYNGAYPYPAPQSPPFYVHPTSPQTTGWAPPPLVTGVYPYPLSPSQRHPQTPPAYPIPRQPNGHMDLYPGSPTSSSSSAAPRIQHYSAPNSSSSQSRVSTESYVLRDDPESALWQADIAFVKKIKRLGKKDIEDQRDYLTNHLIASLSNPVHTLGKLVVDLVTEIEAKQKDDFALLSEVVQKIINFQMDLFELTHLHYASLDESFELRKYAPDQTRQAIEETVFSKVYNPLFAMYTKQFGAKDEHFMTQANKFLTLTPPHLGADTKYWMLNPNSSRRAGGSGSDAGDGDDDDDDRGINSPRRKRSSSFVVLQTTREEEDERHLSNPPYSMAINTLRQLESFRTPSRRLRCLSEAVNQVSRCALAYGRTWKASLESVDTDALISLTAYTLIKSQVPSLYRTKMFCEDFLSDADRMGLPGYFLCSFQTAFDYVCGLDPETLHLNAEAVVDSISKHKEKEPPRPISLPSPPVSTPVAVSPPIDLVNPPEEDTRKEPAVDLFDGLLIPTRQEPEEAPFFTLSDDAKEDPLDLLLSKPLARISKSETPADVDAPTPPTPPFVAGSILLPTPAPSLTPVQPQQSEQPKESLL